MSEPATELSLVLVAAGLTDVGRKREHNEDSVLVRADLALYALADGVGGHNCGEVASALATTSIANYYEATQVDAAKRESLAPGNYCGERRLASAVRKANRDVIEIANATKERQGMGTTMVALSFSARSSMMYVAHAGDSRCYRLRAGVLEALTRDDSILADVLELSPEVDDATWASLPTNIITRALGMDPKMRLSIRSYRPILGDRYLLCTDGLWGMLSDDEIARALSSSAPPAAVAGALVDLANQAGGEDNIGVVVLDCQLGDPSVKRHTPAPKARTRSPRDESAPEIMLVGIEEIDLDGHLRVLTKEGAAAEEVYTADGFPPPAPRRSSPKASPDSPALQESSHKRPCAKCGEAIDTAFCPFCGQPSP